METGNNFLKVLDHGSVRLVEHSGNDLSIVRSARVSYDADWRAGEDSNSDIRLINYLMRNKHTSPFESVVFTFDIECPIFIARQWMRHRTWSYNEQSARYSVLEDSFYLPQEGLITTQSKDNKQSRTNEQHPSAGYIVSCINEQNENSFALYKDLLKEGCPRELARMVLPLNIYTHFFATVDLHNLFHFLRLRLHPHAQWEIQQYAKALFHLITLIVPHATSAFLKYTYPENDVDLSLPVSW